MKAALNSFHFLHKTSTNAIPKHVRCHTTHPKFTRLTDTQSGTIPQSVNETTNTEESSRTSGNLTWEPMPCKEPFHVLAGRKPSFCTPREAVQMIQSNDRVFVHGAAMTPTILLQAMCEHASANNLKNIETIHIHTEGVAPQVSDEYAHHFRDNSLFIASNVRKKVNEGDADATPIFLSDIPHLFRSDDYPIDIALIQISPPDRHGYCSLGPSVDCTRAAVLAASFTVGVINKHVPRTHGEASVHLSHFNTICEHHQPLPEMGGSRNLDETSRKIGQIIADELIPNGATLQMGIGNIPNAVLNALKNHRDLGIHTEMFSDGVLDLVTVGVISNAMKSLHRGKIVSSFCMGTQTLYDFIDDNPEVNLLDCAWVNDTSVIRQNPAMHAINSAIEIDLTGQVVSDSIGLKFFSGVGGQMDFMRGAALSPGGKAIIAISSTTARGESKIVPICKPGSGVVTTRSHVQYVVTEYGWAKLYGKSYRERAKLLIGISHPDHREALEKAAIERFGRLDLD